MESWGVFNCSGVHSEAGSWLESSATFQALQERGWAVRVCVSITDLSLPYCFAEVIDTFQIRAFRNISYV